MLVLLPGGILVTPAVAAHFLGLPNKAVCVRCNIPRSICPSRVEGPMCVNATLTGHSRTGRCNLSSSKAGAFLFFLGCLEPSGVIE